MCIIYALFIFDKFMYAFCQMSDKTHNTFLTKMKMKSLGKKKRLTIK